MVGISMTFESISSVMIFESDFSVIQGLANFRQSFTFEMKTNDIFYFHFSSLFEVFVFICCHVRHMLMIRVQSVIRNKRERSCWINCKYMRLPSFHIWQFYFLFFCINIYIYENKMKKKKHTKRQEIERKRC